MEKSRLNNDDFSKKFLRLEAHLTDLNIELNDLKATHANTADNCLQAQATAQRIQQQFGQMEDDLLAARRSKQNERRIADLADSLIKLELQQKKA
jgi:capsule polysaccharide export protein KpsE/RkpR